MALGKSDLEIWDHLIELRKRLLYCLWALVIGCCVSYFFSEFILKILARPLVSLLADRQGRRFIYTSLTEAFAVHLKIALLGGCVLSCPVWAFQIWRFLAPALYQKEKSFYQWIFALTPLFFIAGACMAYFVVCPCAWEFFLSFESSKVLGIPLQFEAKISEYLGTTLKLMMTFGIGFQLPVVLSCLVVMRIVSLDVLQKGRKYAFLLITVVAAILTPPDLISPLGLMIPVYGLYEGTLLWLRWILKKGDHSRVSPHPLFGEESEKSVPVRIKNPE